MGRGNPGTGLGQDGPVVRIEQTSLGQTVVLDRPERRNALTLALWRELGALVRSADDGTTGPLYLRGAGGYFCSGADLDALRWAREAPGHADDFVEGVVRCLLSLHDVGREVVAVVEGGAAGGGVEIMAACDRRVAIGAPSLVFPFGQHGMQLDGLTRWRLDQLVGERAAERLRDGRHVVPAEEALALGLFDERHESLEAFAAAEHEPTVPTVGDEAGHEHELEHGRAPARGQRYLIEGESLDDAVQRAAAPMRLAFPPHTDR